MSGRTRITRRDFLAAGTAAGLALGLPRTSAAEETIVSTIFGGKFEQVYRKAIVEPFRAKHGANVLLKYGTPSEWLTNAILNRERPEIDVLWLPYPESIKAVNEGLSIELTPEELPNLRDVHAVWYEGYKRKAVGLDYASFGLAYRTDMIAQAPASWQDLWKPGYKGKLILPDLTMSGGYEVLVMAAKLNGGSETEIEPGFKALRQLRPNVRKFYKSQPEAAQLFERGDAAIGAWWDGRTWALTDAGKPMKWVVPKEGAMVGMVSYHIATGTPKKDIAKKFVNFAISPEAQAAFCNGMQYGPVNKKVKLSPPASERVPKLESLLLFDWWKVVPQMAAWLERWNREIAS